MNNEFARARFDPFRFSRKLNVKAKPATFDNDFIDQIGIKPWKGARTTMHNRDLRSSTHRHMGKFKSYVPASDKQDASWKPIKLQELLACRKLFHPRYLQVCWFLASCNDYVASLQDLLAHLDGRWPDEASSTVERSDAGFHEGLFPIPGKRPSEGALKAHQFGPVNLQLLGPDSIPLHSPGPINYLRSADKHLLGIASAQRTRAAERPRIDNCHLPSGRAALIRHSRCPRPGSNSDHVKLLRHTFSSFSSEGLSLAMFASPRTMLHFCAESATAALYPLPCTTAIGLPVRFAEFRRFRTWSS